MPKTKTKTRKQIRNRVGRTVILELTVQSKAKLEAVRAFREHSTGEKVNKSDVLRNAISSLYDNLPESFRIYDLQA